MLAVLVSIVSTLSALAQRVLAAPKEPARMALVVVDAHRRGAAGAVPMLETVTPELRIERAEVITAPAAGYRLTLRNLSDTAIASVHAQSYSVQGPGRRP